MFPYGSSYGLPHYHGVCCNTVQAERMDFGGETRCRPGWAGFQARWDSVNVNGAIIIMLCSIVYPHVCTCLFAIANLVDHFLGAGVVMAGCR